MRKDYKRQLAALAFAVVFSGLIALLSGMTWIGFVILLVISYAGAYQGALQWSATTRAADRDKN